MIEQLPLSLVIEPRHTPRPSFRAAILTALDDYRAELYAEELDIDADDNTRELLCDAILSDSDGYAIARRIESWFSPSASTVELFDDIWQHANGVLRNMVTEWALCQPIITDQLSVGQLIPTGEVVTYVGEDTRIYLTQHPDSKYTRRIFWEHLHLPPSVS